MFDPRTDYLVQVFPFGFWRDITLLIGAVTLVGAAVLWGMGAALRKYLVRTRPDEEESAGAEESTGAEESAGLTCLRMYANEMEARMAEELLRDGGIGSVVRPELGGYGIAGQNQFTPHGVVGAAYGGGGSARTAIECRRGGGGRGVRG